MALIKSTPAHPHSQIFALHEGQPLWDLSESIKKNGLREPIVLLEGLVLDGRRRELGCFRAKVAPVYREFGSRDSDGDDPLEFVVDINLHRRHLGEGERILAAAKYATAKSGNPKKQDAENKGDTTQPCQLGTVTNADAAEKFEVSERSVDRAKKVLANGTHKLQEAVEDGTISVSDAAKVAREPAKIQNKAVKDVERGKAKSASAAAKSEKNKKLAKSVQNALADTWHAECARILSKIRTECKAAFSWSSYLDASVLDYLKSAEECFLAAVPRCVCPDCHGEKVVNGKSCLTCRQGGYLASQVV